MAERLLALPRFNGNMLNALWDPAWDRFQSDPRYAELLEHTGLEGAELRLAPPGQ